jgi:hypothetical protein
MPPNAHRLDQRKLIPLVDLAGLVLFSSLLRLTLAVNFPPASQVSFADYIWVMLVGLHLDLVAGLILLTPVVFWCAFVPERWWLSRWHRSR